MRGSMSATRRRKTILNYSCRYNCPSWFPLILRSTIIDLDWNHDFFLSLAFKPFDLMWALFTSYKTVSMLFVGQKPIYLCVPIFWNTLWSVLLFMMDSWRETGNVKGKKNLCLKCIYITRLRTNDLITINSLDCAWISYQRLHHSQRQIMFAYKPQSLKPL